MMMMINDDDDVDVNVDDGDVRFCSQFDLWIERYLSDLSQYFQSDNSR